MKLSRSAKNAILIGSLCSVSYLAVYIARNILGAVSTHLESDGYSEAYIGTLSSIYLIFYAVGQLINGAIGDKIKARYMISFGLLLAAITNGIFPFIVEHQGIAPFLYGLTGFFLAMIYGPMTKVVAENTEPHLATRCSLGYTFASFFGSPLAGVIATLFVWQTAFFVSSGALVVMAVLAFSFFLLYEKKGIVRYGQYKRKKADRKGLQGIRVLLKHRIVKFSLISMLTGVIRTSVVFWLPIYISKYHHFSDDDSSVIFSVATLVLSFTTFVAVFVYERLKRNMDLTILLMFSLSTVFFILVYCIKAPLPNIILLILAVMACNSSATMLWSRYCPSLRDTGMVSSATGFLDFLSYTAAAISNVVFPNAVSVIGWGNLILVWAGLMAVGVIVALPYGKFFKKQQNTTQNA